MYYIGQRWYSEAEPELGLGIITQVESKVVQVLYSDSEQVRSYGFKTAPLKRFMLEVGDQLETSDGFTCEVLETNLEENIYFYRTKTNVIAETQLKAQINIDGPVDRLLIQNYDSPQFFNLRYQAYLANRDYQSFAQKGFLGAKIVLIPHQIFLCHDILKMPSPKVMLCDEVGLGKTIEASLILHSLIQREIVTSTIIVVPESLTNQWFVELYKKFSLNFEVLNSDHAAEINLENTSRYIISSQLLKTDDKLRDQVLATKWDMLIADETHQIPFFSQESILANTLKSINSQSHATLFLSATPEIMGLENLYSQLNTLDPERYTSFDKFKLQHESFQEVSMFIKSFREGNHDPGELLKYITEQEQETLKTDEDTIQRIVDRFGAGRNYFRNSRSHLEKYTKLFTKRKCFDYPLQLSGKINDKTVIDEKSKKLIDIIKSINENKIFVICHSKEIIQKLSRKLLEVDNYKIALFHSDQSLLERDRQAAYFSDPDGAQILLSTEVGSEGRNFEFAHHMFLFDLPKLPDQLEQRIGRLDRIGQLNDISIHVPYIMNTFEHTLFHWYSDVLGAFSEFPKGGNSFYESNQEEIKNLLTSSYNEKTINKSLSRLKNEYQEYQKLNETGRDALLETRSFNPNIANHLISDIRNYEEASSCKDFLDLVFNEIGIDFEPLNSHSYFIRPSHNMLIPSYPGLLPDGMGITFEREYANHHQNVDLISWEHPIVKSAFDIILNSPLGNTTVLTTDDLPRDIYFEYIISLQCTDASKFESCTYLPYTPLRVLTGLTSGDLTLKIPKKAVDKCQFESPSDEHLSLLKQLPKEEVKAMSQKALNIAQKRSEKYKIKALSEIDNFYTGEMNRQKTLIKDAKLLAASLKSLGQHKDKLKTSIENAVLKIDSLRVILPLE